MQALVKETGIPNCPLNDVFIDTVEALSGDVSISSEREALTEFSIFQKNSQKIQASANLNSEQYRLADHTHLIGTQYVLIEDMPNSCRRVGLFDYAKTFKLSFS